MVVQVRPILFPPFFYSLASASEEAKQICACALSTSFVPLQSMDGKWEMGQINWKVVKFVSEFVSKDRQNNSVFVAFSWFAASDIDGGKDDFEKSKNRIFEHIFGVHRVSFKSWVMWSRFAAIGWWRRKGGVECRGARRRVTLPATGTPMTTSTRGSSPPPSSTPPPAGRCWSQTCPAAPPPPSPLLDRGVLSSNNKPPAMLQQNCFTIITGVDFQQWELFLETTFALFRVSSRTEDDQHLSSGWVATKQTNEWRMHVNLWQSGISGWCKSVNPWRISGTNTSRVWYQRT